MEADRILTRFIPAALWIIRIKVHPNKRHNSWL